MGRVFPTLRPVAVMVVEYSGGSVDGWMKSLASLDIVDVSNELIMMRCEDLRGREALGAGRAPKSSPRKRETKDGYNTVLLLSTTRSTSFYRVSPPPTNDPGCMSLGYKEPRVVDCPVQGSSYTLSISFHSHTMIPTPPAPDPGAPLFCARRRRRFASTVSSARALPLS